MMLSLCSTRLVSNTMLRSSRSMMVRRFLSVESTTARQEVSTQAAAAAISGVSKEGIKSWWKSAEVWGGLGAVVGWGMSGTAIYGAFQEGPEVISLTMTPVLIVYSTLFVRWAWVVNPRNTWLCACHVANVMAQLNQLKRALDFKLENGESDQVNDMMKKAGLAGTVTGAAIVAGPRMRSVLSGANLGILSSVAAADAGPFTVHFWAPMSKWFISGASFLDLHRPTDKISLPQYTSLTLTGFVFSRYALLVTPIGYLLCSVNIALFLSSAWHLGRKIKTDFIDVDTNKPASA